MRKLFFLVVINLLFSSNAFACDEKSTDLACLINRVENEYLNQTIPVEVGPALVQGYAALGDIERAKAIYESLPNDKHIPSWSAEAFGKYLWPHPKVYDYFIRTGNTGPIFLSLKKEPRYFGSCEVAGQIFAVLKRYDDLRRLLEIPECRDMNLNYIIEACDQVAPDQVQEFSSVLNEKISRYEIRSQFPYQNRIIECFDRRNLSKAVKVKHSIGYYLGRLDSYLKEKKRSNKIPSPSCYKNLTEKDYWILKNLENPENASSESEANRNLAYPILDCLQISGNYQILIELYKEAKKPEQYVQQIIKHLKMRFSGMGKLLDGEKYLILLDVPSTDDQKAGILRSYMSGMIKKFDKEPSSDQIGQLASNIMEHIEKIVTEEYRDQVFLDIFNTYIQYNYEDSAYEWVQKHPGIKNFCKVQLDLHRSGHADFSEIQKVCANEKNFLDLVSRNIHQGDIKLGLKMLEILSGDEERRLIFVGMIDASIKFSKPYHVRWPTQDNIAHVKIKRGWWPGTW